MDQLCIEPPSSAEKLWAGGPHAATISLNGRPTHTWLACAIEPTEAQADKPRQRAVALASAGMAGRHRPKAHRIRNRTGLVIT